MVWGQLVSESTLLVFGILLLASVQFLVMLLVFCYLANYVLSKQDVRICIISPHLGEDDILPASCFSKAFIPYFSKSRVVLCK